MATQLQELQAKRKELQATNPNASMLDARNALTPAISNAPVAWQPPATPTTTTTPSVHDWWVTMWEMQNRARKDAWDRAKNPEKWLKMAYDPNTYDVFKESMLWPDEVNPWFTKTPNWAMMDSQWNVYQTPESWGIQKTTTPTQTTPTETTPTPQTITPPPKTEKKAEIVTP